MIFSFKLTYARAAVERVFKLKIFLEDTTQPTQHHQTTTPPPKSFCLIERGSFKTGQGNVQATDSSEP